MKCSAQRQGVCAHNTLNPKAMQLKRLPTELLLLLLPVHTMLQLLLSYRTTPQFVPHQVLEPAVLKRRSALALIATIHPHYVQGVGKKHKFMEQGITSRVVDKKRGGRYDLFKMNILTVTVPEWRQC